MPESPLMELPPMPYTDTVDPDSGYARYTEDEMRAYAEAAVLQERRKYDWILDNAVARIALATEVFGYEKMDVPTAEWLDAQIAAAIRGT